MSKTHLLINKKNPVLSIVNKPKSMIQNTTTYRQPLKQDDGQKLYTFCSSQQKPQGMQQTQQERNVSRERKTSFNNVRGKVYQPLSRSKGKTVSQVNINKDRKNLVNNSACNNTSLVLNNSALLERRKTDKMTVKQPKKEEKMINISINLNRNALNQTLNKENHFQQPSFLQDRKSPTEYFFNKEKQYLLEGGKKTIVMSEEELQNFTKKHASQKLNLEQSIDLLKKKLKDFEQKEIEWKHFKKDSEEYIKYLAQQKEQALSHYESLKQEINQLNNDKEYEQIAKEEYKSTIHQQQSEIHTLKRQLSNLKQENTSLKESIKTHGERLAELQNSRRERSAPVQMLEVQNLHLKKQLQISERHQSNRSFYLKDIDELQNKILQLTSTNQILSAQMKEMYIYKLKCDVLEKSLQEATNKIAKLTQQLQGVKFRVKSASSVCDKSGSLSEFEFRYDQSPHSPSQVEVVWKRDFDETTNHQQQNNIQEYFDHDFFSGFSKHKY